MEQNIATLWKNFLLQPGGLEDSVNQIDNFLSKFNINDDRAKLKIFISNIISYFKRLNIIEIESNDKEIERCSTLISKQISLGEIKSSTDFVLRVLVAIFSKVTGDKETNYLTNRSENIIDPKIEEISRNFLEKHSKFKNIKVKNIEMLEREGKKIILQETVANRQKLAKDIKLRYV
jgi:hypothetical protein